MPPARSARPLDFVSFHAKGAPKFIDGHVRMGLADHLRVIDDGFRLVASDPEWKAKPIVIGESDPEGCAACQGPALAYRNGTMYSSYTAASFARIHDLAEKHGVNLEGVLTWAFEFEDQPYFAGLPVARQQRHRQAGAQCVPDVQPNERPTAPRRKRCRPVPRRPLAPGRAGEARRVGLGERRADAAVGAGLALPRRRCARPAGGRRVVGERPALRPG